MQKSCLLSLGTQVLRYTYRAAVQLLLTGVVINFYISLLPASHPQLSVDFFLLSYFFYLFLVFCCEIIFKFKVSKKIILMKLDSV